MLPTHRQLAGAAMAAPATGTEKGLSEGERRRRSPTARGSDERVRVGEPSGGQASPQERGDARLGLERVKSHAGTP
jgi:hypothetical protein